MELNIKALAKNVNPNLKIYGKRSSHLSEALGYNPNIVASALTKILNLKAPVGFEQILGQAERLKEGLPIRSPTFCPGCSHRGTFIALHRALRGVKYVLATDIGYYSMNPLPPLNYGDTLLSMWASLGVAHGLQYAIEEPVIAMIGD